MFYAILKAREMYSSYCLLYLLFSFCEVNFMFYAILKAREMYSSYCLLYFYKNLILIYFNRNSKKKHLKDHQNTSEFKRSKRQVESQQREQRKVSTFEGCFNKIKLICAVYFDRTIL